MKMRTLSALIIAAAVAGIVGCSSQQQPAAAEPTTVTNPKQGWVTVAQHDRPGDLGNTIVQKTCDGTTLLYYAYSLRSGSGGVSAILNSPECKSP